MRLAINGVSWLVLLFLEFLAWFGLAILFLVGYVEKYSGPYSAIQPHLFLVANIWILALGVRVFFHLWSGESWRRMGLAFSVAIWSLLFVYYCLVFIGLGSWGRVITWNLIATYAVQWRELVHVLGESVTKMVALSMASVLVVLLLVIGWPKRLMWLQYLAARLSKPATSMIAIGLLLISLTNLYGFSQRPPVEAGEPVALTFFPERSARMTQIGFLPAAPFLEEKEVLARKEYQANSKARRRNVVLIVSDALRPDHMGIYGYDRPTTPYLSELDRAGMLYKQARAWSVCGESACGLLAMARSKYVHQQTWNAIALHEVLNLHGYETYMIMGGDHTNFYNLKSAYGTVDHYYDGASATDFYMNDDAFLLRRTEVMPAFSGRPVFLQYHFMSTHGLGRRHDKYQRFRPWRNYYRGSGMLGGDDISIEEAANFYDNGVLQFDQKLQELLGVLKRKGYLDDALVVITSDHGEMLGEHGKFSHLGSVYEQVLRIPLLMVDFSGNSLAVLDSSIPASQVDIAPTILNVLNMPVPSTWSGRALREGVTRDFLFFQQGSEVGLLDFRRDGRVRKYWVNVSTGKEMIFDVTEQGGELVASTGHTYKDITVWRQMVTPQIASATNVVNR